MTNLLIRLFISDSKNVQNPDVREKYGRLGSVVGIIVNIFLSIFKFAVGMAFGSISIRADAVNNLSDAGSSVISLFSFKFSNRPADAEHPFGHARIEYAASFAVAFFILMLGFEVLRSAVLKIINPDPVAFSIITCAVLIASVIFKLWLCGFYKKLSKKINSKVLKAASADSLSDVISTSGVLLSVVLSKATGFQLDGYTGVIVAVFILISGINIVRDTLDEFLGQPPDKSFVENIEKKILSYDGILGLHDLVVHNYGPQKTFASVHAEVSASADILKSHEIIDDIERDFLKNDGIHLLIHLDPVVTDDAFVNELKEYVLGIVNDIDDSLSMHDFRVVLGTEHSNLIFDIVLPYSFRMTEDEVVREIDKQIKKINPTYNTVITVDKMYLT